MSWESGYNKYYSYLSQYTNDTKSTRYVLYITRGGSGFDIDTVSPCGTWYEGVGEESIGDFDTYELAEERCREYYEGQAKEIINNDPQLTTSERQEMIEVIPDIIRETPRSNEAADKFKKLLKKAAKATASALRDLLVDIAAEAIKRMLWP